MFFTRNKSIVFLLFPSFITLIFIETAIFHIYKLGKSKTHVKKISKAIPKFDKLSLNGYVERCAHHRKLAIQIRRFYLAYMCILIGGCAIFILSAFISALEKVFNYIGFVKFLTMDVPFITFSIFNTKHDKKHGGVTWKWDAT